MLLYLLILGPPILIALYAQMKTSSAFKKYSQVGTTSGVSGAEAAAMMLQSQGIEVVSSPEAAKQRDNAVAIESIGGFLTDHYDPRAKVLRLSPQVYSGRSISAVGVACHEAGHALQHAQSYAFLNMRSAMVPVVSFGSNLAPWLIIIGLAISLAKLAVFGLVLYVAVVAFTLVTLPVEFNASNRAKAALANIGVIRLPAEQRGVAAVLDAAALTYVAAAITAIAHMIYWAMLVFGGRRD